MAESDSRAPRFDTFPPGMEGKLSDELHHFSVRVGTAVACLKAWYQMHEMGVYFDDARVPEEMRPLVDQLVKKTRTALQDWNEIPKDANLQSGPDKT